MNKEDLASDMLNKFGHVIGGEDLRKTLGFRTQSAFARALRENLVEIPIFSIPGRRGKFALTGDVVAWLQSLRENAPAKTREL